MSFTPREHAASVYGACRSMGRGRVKGGDMEMVTAERLALLARAEAAIDRAIGTEGRFVEEPGDEQLQQFRWHIARIRDAVEHVGKMSA
jgi:hypothetical protein